LKRFSISRIKLFKACRRAYELKYRYGLEPVSKAESLMVGSSYHDKLEQLYNTGTFENDFSKESAMATAYRKYIYPEFHVKAAEEWVRMYTDEGEVVGRVDGIAEDGRLVEHKTTSLSPLEFEYNLQWDEQVLAYMLMTGAREVWYTICRKPTIRQKKDESDQEFYQRMVDWYDEDTDNKIKLIVVSRTDDEVQAFAESLKDIMHEMNCTNNFYRNTSHCRCYGRQCEYSSVCLHYDPDAEYIEFTKQEGDGYSYAGSEF